MHGLAGVMLAVELTEHAELWPTKVDSRFELAKLVETRNEGPVTSGQSTPRMAAATRPVLIPFTPAATASASSSAEVRVDVGGLDQTAEVAARNTPAQRLEVRWRHGALPSLWRARIEVLGRKTRPITPIGARECGGGRVWRRAVGPRDD